MITFLRTVGCTGCEASEEVVEELCIAHKVVTTGQDAKSCTLLSDGAEPPMLVDGDRTFQGHKDVIAHLQKLEGFRDLWYRFQSDACYCNESGQIE